MEVLCSGESRRVALWPGGSGVDWQVGVLRCHALCSLPLLPKPCLGCLFSALYRTFRRQDRNADAQPPDAG
jgi:hypothetical protein